MARSHSLLFLLWALGPAVALPQGAAPAPDAAPAAEATPPAPAAAPSVDAPAPPAAAAPAAVATPPAPPPEAKAPPPAGGGAAAAAPARLAATAPQSADDLADLKVKTLEERVNELKEKIFRTKARLMNLQEMVIGGDVTTGAKAVVYHRNEMGPQFVLESATYTIDGAPVYTKVDKEGDLDKREEFEVFNGRVVPGNHQVTVKLLYRGHGYGVFSYLDGYRFKVQSSYTFNAEPGKVTSVKVVGFEKGGITAELQNRPAIRYDVDVKSDERGQGRPAAAPAGGDR
ncbi:MAG TPA: dihydrolipoamide acetyltransferase [Anaeromyxobacteraceae bacterium]|nr:dihydrolipoamide acetyltransferase [Anaeromyxobacteraceae bacterium]